jgi:predicted Zn-dependent protease
VLLAGLVACTEPAAPPRADSYPFDDAGAVFHWPAARLPVRFWADRRGNMGDLMRSAIAVWEGQLLYGEFHGVLVDDSSRADVIALWSGTVPTDAPPDTGPPVLACSGAATNAAAVFADSSDVVLYIDLEIRGAFTDAQIAACMRRVAIHEVAHTLGILTHSPDANDIMHGNVLVAAPSDRDRQTMEVLHHTTPTIMPPPR